MLAEPHTSDGRDSATHHRAGYRSARLSLTWSSWPLWSYLCQPLVVAPLSALRSSKLS